MSVQAVRAVFDLRDPRLTAVERYVLLNFAEHANADTMLSWPSAGTVSAETGLGVSTVEKALGKLRTLGYLVKHAKQRVGEHAWVWVYRVSTAVEVPSVGGIVDGEDPSLGDRGSLSRADEDPSVGGTNRKEEPEGKTSERPPDGVPSAASLDEQRQKRRRDLLFDAIVEVCEYDPSKLTASSRSLVGKTRRELAEVSATPEDVRARAEEYHRRFRSAALTPTALLKHWPSLAPSGPAPLDTWLYR